ncbi:hypothetical protein D3C72_2093950 [compost metagenome]
MAGLPAAPQPGAAAAVPQYDAASAVQVLGAGALDANETAKLTGEEQRRLAM